MDYRRNQQSDLRDEQAAYSHRQSYRRSPSAGLESLAPHDSASNLGGPFEDSNQLEYQHRDDYLAYDPYSRQQRHSYQQQDFYQPSEHRQEQETRSETPSRHSFHQQRNSRHQYSQSQDEGYLQHDHDASSLPLVHFAGNAGGSIPPQSGERTSVYSGATRSYLPPPRSRYSALGDTKEAESQNSSEGQFESYPPLAKEKDPFSDPPIDTLDSKVPIERPSIWKRLIRDTTPLEQRIKNHKKGVGVQNRPWLCWILSFGMVAALIAEMGQNWRLTGIPISTKPYFNYMIGPSANVLIYTGARFTPCIKEIPSVSDQNFACLNNTQSIPSTFCTLSEICGFGGFPSGQPDQSFRFILPIFLCVFIFTLCMLSRVSHAGIIHIFFNLLVQNTSSAQIEREMGSLRFFVLYFCSGIFGFVLGGNFALVGQPSVGASGAIYGTQAALFVDLMAHWSIERKPIQKLIFLLIEIIIGFGIGFIPNTIDNFSHIGGFLMGLCVSVVLYPAIHQTRRHRITFYVLRCIAIPGVIILFVVLIRNFYTSDPSQACSWCRYLSCWPTAANNRCQGTGLTTVTSTTSSASFLSVAALAIGYLVLR